MRALLWPVTDWPVWVQTVTELADTTGVGAALSSDCLFGVGTVSHCGGGDFR